MNTENTEEEEDAESEYDPLKAVLEQGNIEIHQVSDLGGRTISQRA